MKETAEKKRRPRRTQVNLKKDLWEALEKLITQNGFGNVALTALTKEAQVEPIVIYKNYKSMDGLYEEYTKTCDFWFKDIFKVDEKMLPKDNLKKMLVDLVNELYENEIMQKMLLWELNNNNDIPRKIAQTREFHSGGLINYFKENLRDMKTRFSPATALMISGIYYLIMHRKVSTFSNINFDTPEGKALLIDTISSMIDLLYVKNDTSKSEKQQYMEDVAHRLLLSGVDKNIITSATGLSIEEINSLIP